MLLTTKFSTFKTYGASYTSEAQCAITCSTGNAKNGPTSAFNYAASSCGCKFGASVAYSIFFNQIGGSSLVGNCALYAGQCKSPKF